MTTGLFWKTAIVAAVLAGVSGSAAWAHHSHAMFDDTKEITIKGEVKNFNFANPHVYLFVEAPGPGGAMTDYPIEMSFTQAMIKQGIKGDTFKPGDKVTVAYNPLRDGRPGGSYTNATDAQGGKHGRYPGGCQAGQTGCAATEDDQ